MADVHRKRAFQFSIAALLFLMLCLAGYLSGYRTGFDAGKKDASQGQIIRVVYPVGDLITPRNGLRGPADYDSLIDLIETTVAPQDWLTNGTGEGEIAPFPANLSLIVSQTKQNHEAVSALLRQLRTMQPAAVSAAANAQTP